MRRIALFISAALIAGTAHIQAQGLGEVIRTSDKAVPVINQNLEGTWLYELRRGGQPATQPPVLLLIQFHSDGRITASAADGTQSSHHGEWLRVGDHKFLITTFLFSFNEARAFTNIIKVRANVQLGPDGQTANGTQEIVLLDPAGRVLTTIPGGTFTGVRLNPEIPGDFYDFQKNQ
jgi:hypothetical protein